MTSIEKTGNAPRRRVLIIGAGPGGLCAAIALQKSGRRDFTILEKASGPGGTWYHNRYPGAACDVASHLYSFSFERRMDWPRPFSEQPDILAYFEDCVSKYALAPHIRFDTPVASAHWDDEENLWRVVTAQGETFEAEILIGALGMFNELHWPEIPGLAEFGGTSFHSARWNQDHDLTGRRVAVIGSAASAVQLLPPVARMAAHVDLYQRTANWVLPKADTPFTAEEIESFHSDPRIADELREALWQEIEEIVTYDDEDKMRAAEEVGRRNLEQVEDPILREKLHPTHPYGCKRPLLSNDYYPTFNRSNVELVTDAIERIDAKGVVTVDGRLREADTLILASGFQTAKFLSAIEVRGRGGRDLEKDWAEGARAYLGSTIPGYPNLFMLYGPNTNSGSILHMIESQVAYALRQIERIEAEDLAWLEVREDVHDRFNDELQERISGIGPWQASCPGYYRSESGRVVTQWPSNTADYRRRMQKPDVEAYQVGYRSA